MDMKAALASLESFSFKMISHSIIYKRDSYRFEQKWKTDADEIIKYCEITKFQNKEEKEFAMKMLSKMKKKFPEYLI